MQVDYGDEPESDHSLHLTANYEHAGNNGNPAYSPFRHPSTGVPAIDPGLEQSTGANRNGHAPMSVISHSANNHLLQPDNASISSAHLGFYGDMARRTPTPTNASPRYSAATPSSQTKHVTTSSYTPDDRALPSQDVTDETFDNAFASFILYCNPSFALSTDTSELVKLFRIPPKSDGNAFSTWSLFELIGKFSAGEIKTWTQLALDLGVSLPDTDKGQSTQKVQQYSVRLKVRCFSLHCIHFRPLSNYLKTSPTAQRPRFRRRLGLSRTSLCFRLSTQMDLHYSVMRRGRGAHLDLHSQLRLSPLFSLVQATLQAGTPRSCMNMLPKAAIMKPLVPKELTYLLYSFLHTLLYWRRALSSWVFLHLTYLLSMPFMIMC
jgi:hypothetical protein